MLWNCKSCTVVVLSDKSDVSTAKVKDDAIISKDSWQISTETREYSDNSPSKNEKTMKENEGLLVIRILGIP
jgi:hypothetical protein